MHRKYVTITHGHANNLNNLNQTITHHIPSAACLRATAYGASAHHMYNYVPNRCSPAHRNLQSSREGAEHTSTIQAHNFNMPYMKESLGS